MIDQGTMSWSPEVTSALMRLRRNIDNMRHWARETERLNEVMKDEQRGYIRRAMRAGQYKTPPTTERDALQQWIGDVTSTQYGQDILYAHTFWAAYARSVAAERVALELLGWRPDGP